MHTWEAEEIQVESDVMPSWKEEKIQKQIRAKSGKRKVQSKSKLGREKKELAAKVILAHANGNRTSSSTQSPVQQVSGLWSTPPLIKQPYLFIKPTAIDFPLN